MIIPNNIYNMDCMAGMAMMADNSVDFTLTDIPYDSVNKLKWKGDADILTFNLSRFLNEVNRITKNNIVIFCGYPQLPVIMEHLRKFGTVRPLIWEKDFQIAEPHSLYYFNTECAVYLSRVSTYNGKNKSCVFRIPWHRHYPGNRSHPTAKPVDLFKELILDNTKPADIVLDTCLGSGTTAVAALLTGRRYIGFELNKKYYDDAKKRLNTKPLK